MRRRVVFLDRDGVINKLVYRDGGWFSPQRFSEFVLEDGISEVSEELKRSGFDLIVVTNQPDIARGKLSRRDLHLMNQMVSTTLQPLDIFVCPHDTDDNCECRKPLPGMLLTAIYKYDIDKASSFLIGDRLVDAKAAISAGVKPIILEKHYSLESGRIKNLVPRVTSLQDALVMVRAADR